MNDDKKILLTGGSGLVGKNIREHPSAAKWKILAPTRKELDLSDLSSVSRWVKKHQPEIIIHAAGLVGGIKANIQDPLRFLDVNARIGRNIIMVAKDCNVSKFINLGSSCMYPKSIQSPLSEEKLMAGKLEPTNEGYALANYLQPNYVSILVKKVLACTTKHLSPVTSTENMTTSI